MNTTQNHDRHELNDPDPHCDRCNIAVQRGSKPGLCLKCWLEETSE